MVRFLHKISSVAGKVPAAADLIQREFAYNSADALIYALNNAGAVVCLNAPAEPIYNAATLYRSNATARVLGSAVTDANGRITVNLTKDGSSTGVAIFSKILSKQATVQLTGSYAPYAAIETVTAKQVVFRCVAGVGYVGSGYTVDYDIQGFT